MKQILVRTDKCLGCKSCELACSVAHSRSEDLYGAFLSGEKPIKRLSVESDAGKTINLPIQCRHCREPRCAGACMTGAIGVDEKSGLVVNDDDKCVGCWMCAMVCPYGVISPNFESGKAVKCDQCFSLSHDPACVKACPTGAVKLVAIDKFSGEMRKQFLSDFIRGEGV